MSTPQSTTSGEAPQSNLEQITFRFCSECSNMLYPKEDEVEHKLMFTCRTCQYTEPAASSCVFRHVLNNAAGETAGVTQDVGSDPTVCGPVPSFSSTATPATSTSASTSTSAPVPGVSTHENPLATCLRCGLTLLHCSVCQDPASVDEYNDYVIRDPDFAVQRALRCIRLANLWAASDTDTQAALEERFTTTNSLQISGLGEESLTDYLPFDATYEDNDDPAEALSEGFERMDTSEALW